MCVLQTDEPTTNLVGVNAYRRAMQYQQLEKLQQAGDGTHGFYVQVPSFYERKAKQNKKRT